jgi:hypothetical protein
MVILCGLVVANCSLRLPILKLHFTPGPMCLEQPAKEQSCECHNSFMWKMSTFLSFSQELFTKQVEAIAVVVCIAKGHCDFVNKILGQLKFFGLKEPIMELKEVMNG